MAIPAIAGLRAPAEVTRELGGNVRTKSPPFRQKVFGSGPTYLQKAEICSDRTQNSQNSQKKKVPQTANFLRHIDSCTPTQNVRTPRPTSAADTHIFARIPTDIMGIWGKKLIGPPTKLTPYIRGSRSSTRASTEYQLAPAHPPPPRSRRDVLFDPCR